MTVVKLSGYTKIYQSVQFKWVNFVVCETYFSKAIKKIKQRKQTCTQIIVTHQCDIVCDGHGVGIGIFPILCLPSAA